MPPFLCNLFHYIISRLLLMSFNRPPPAAAGTQPISNPNSTTTTSLPSPHNNVNYHDLESGNQPSPIPIPSNNIDIELPEWKRISKFVQTVSFGGFGGFISLLVNNPASAATNPALSMGYFTFVCLGLASSICLSAFSIINQGTPTVCVVQKKLMYFNFFFALLAVCFRLTITLQLVAACLVTVLVAVGLLAILLYLLLSSRCQLQPPH